MPMLQDSDFSVARIGVDLGMQVAQQLILKFLTWSGIIEFVFAFISEYFFGYAVCAPPFAIATYDLWFQQME